MEVATLRNLGFKVFVTHKRIWESGGPGLLTKKEAAAKGLDTIRNTPFFSKKSCPHIAETIVAVYDKQTGDLLAKGVSQCGRKDTFNRKLGTSIALGRAIKANQLSPVQSVSSEEI